MKVFFLKNGVQDFSPGEAGGPAAPLQERVGPDPEELGRRYVSVPEAIAQFFVVIAAGRLAGAVALQWGRFWR